MSAETINAVPAAFSSLARRAAQHEGREAGLPGRVDLRACPECGTVHPYGGLCTRCLERQARREESREAVRQGYRAGRDGRWHRPGEQARDEKGVFGEDGGRV